MDTAEKNRSPVYRQLEAYEESWKKDHGEAIVCRDWEDAIAVGISIFRMLREREEVWRDQVFRGIIPFTEDDNLDHQSRYSHWLDTTKEVLITILPLLEKRFGRVEGAEELRNCSESAEKILQEWQPPRISAAVGLREMNLSEESAAELDRILQEAKDSARKTSKSKMQEMPAEELRRRLRD